MTESDVARIEAKLGLDLPGFYRGFVLCYPEALLQLDPRVAEFELLNSPEPIIKLNRMVRVAPSIDWPEEFLVIGQSGCGDYYAIDMDEDDSAVYLWNHEIGGFDDREETESLLEFAGNLLTMYRMLHAMRVLTITHFT